MSWRSLGYLPGASDSAYFSSETVNDPIGQRALVEHSSTYYQGPLQTWSSLFSNPASWSPLSPAGPAPPSASYAPMYDPLRDRVLFLDRRTNSLWALNWGRPPIEAQAVALADIKRAHDRSGRGEQSLAILGSATLDVRELVPQAVVVGDTPVGNGAEFAFRDVNRDGILDLVVGTRRQFPRGRHQLGGQSVRALMRDGRAVRGTFRFGSAGPVVGQKAGALVITSVSASGSAIRILLRSDALHDISVRLFDPAGRFIEGGSPRTGISGGATISLPLPPHVAPGIYLVTATDGHVSATSKCLVLR